MTRSSSKPTLPWLKQPTTLDRCKFVTAPPWQAIYVTHPLLPIQPLHCWFTTPGSAAFPHAASEVLALSDFLLGPGKTALAADELVKEILLPIPDKHQAAAFTRLTRRKGVDLATINLCCQVTKKGVTRFALGAVGPVPFLVEEHEGILSSLSNSPETKRVEIAKLMEKATPISDVRASKEYRQAMLTVLGQRALDTALDRLQAMQ